MNTINMKSNLENMRVTNTRLAFVIGLSEELIKLSNQELSSEEYFGQYGTVVKISKNTKQQYDRKGKNGPSFSVHVTYSNQKEASLAILTLYDQVVDSHTIKTSYGTSKYCINFISNKKCMNKECLYLHKIDKYNSLDKVYYIIYSMISP